MKVAFLPACVIWVVLYRQYIRVIGIVLLHSNGDEIAAQGDLLAPESYA